MRSARRAYIIGVKVGQTNVYFFDADGNQIGGLDIAVRAQPQWHPCSHQADPAQRKYPG